MHVNALNVIIKSECSLNIHEARVKRGVYVNNGLSLETISAFHLISLSIDTIFSRVSIPMWCEREPIPKPPLPAHPCIYR